MEFLYKAIWKLNKDTSTLKSHDIQEVLLSLKKNAKHDENLTQNWNEMVEKLWFHLCNELQEYDDQLLCSISFFTALNKCQNEEFYLKLISQIIKNEIETDHRTSVSRMSLAISLCYGIFQSSYILQQVENQTQPSTITFQNMIEIIFNLLVQETYKYTKHTFVVFKVLTSLKKIYSTPLHGILLNHKNQIKLLNLINHNWENPINGIRNLNRIVFQNLLLFLRTYNIDMYELVLFEINGFYWNKAKYLMLAEVIEQSNEAIKDLVSKNNWINGLIYSLSKPGLVSAGADMYNAVLKKINTDTIWIELFMCKLLETLRHACEKVIENFSNYWCLNTFKKFPGLSRELIEGIYNIDDSEYKLYIIMNIMKQSNKLGLIDDIIGDTKVCFKYKTHVINNPVLFSLEHSNASVRMLAFEIICLHQSKSFPIESLYKHILKYLSDNINSDCTVLRISMINSLSIFLTKMLTLFLNTKSSNENKETQSFIVFCEDLQNLVIESQEINGNYQRKITCVKVIYTIFKCLSEVPRKKRDQIRHTNTSLVDYLKENGHWKFNNHSFILTLINLMKDPAKDVNEGVFQLLSDYYLEELSKPSIINFLIDEGQKYIARKFFYEASCGQIIFKLIIKIIKNNENKYRFRSINDIFNFAYKEVSLLHTNKRDIVKSIEDGKQLHSFLSILSLTFEDSIRNCYITNISIDTIYSLLDIVEIVSNQFVWEEDLSVCSDFSKMSEMVQTMIKESGIENEQEEDKTQISGLHQIVLNSLWLNVKASCELAALIIQCYKENQDICERCLNIIINVLETSRHKGAIEAAGAVLGNAIQFLTSLTKEHEVSLLPLRLLKKKLNELFLETNKMSSITRRGAGLSIMVHRIVSNDLKKSKHLFHYFIKTLLDTCNNSDNSNISEGYDTDNKKDLPKAIYIHLLTRIVTDSSLAADTMFYSAELAALAFDNLSDNHWQIRNAALQLYGALIPKLIGQKKASGIDEETVATVGCDEFRTHSPKLWNYMIEQIQSEDYIDILQGHSNLVPVLNALASLAKRYTFSYDFNDQQMWEKTLLSCFMSLLGSPIYTVRRLTAQCIVNLYIFQKIYEELSENTICVTENFLHGSILLLINCYKIYDHTECTKLETLVKIYQNILKKRGKSYICQWNMELLVREPEVVDVELIKNIMLEANSNKHKPGVMLWANLKIKKCLEKIAWNMIPEVLALPLQLEELDMLSEILIKRIKVSSHIPKDVLANVLKILLKSDLVMKHSDICRLVYFISFKIDLNLNLFNIDKIIPYVKHTSYKLRYVVPFVTRLLVKQKDNENLLILSHSIYLLSSPDKNDVNMRNIAALSNNEFGYELSSFTDSVKINVIKTAVILLQDEDEDVRNSSVKFYENVVGKTKHPYICLNKILIKEFLNKIFKEQESSIQQLCTDLLNFIDSISVCNKNEYNPFFNDSKNIYLETNLLKQTLNNIMKN